MEFSEKIITSLTVLLTGFVVVFAVLFILIGIIKGYGIIVTKLEQKVKEKKAQKEAASAKPVAPVQQQKPVQITETADSGISDEIVAVIAAAVDAMYGSSGKAKIKSIKKSDSRSAWSKAGILDNTRPF